MLQENKTKESIYFVLFRIWFSYIKQKMPGLKQDGSLFLSHIKKKKSPRGCQSSADMVTPRVIRDLGFFQLILPHP